MTELEVAYEESLNRALGREIKLEQDLAECKKDAERYQFLKANYVDEGHDGDLQIHFRCDFCHYNDIDGSIDAAMKEEAK
jgi:hypothetical protein